MKTIVADTSALISLALSRQIETVVEEISISIPYQVKEELTEMSSYSDEEGKAAKKILLLINKDRINFKKISSKEKAVKLVSKSIDLGEAECIVLASDLKIPVVLMDDINAAYSLSMIAKAKKISIKISAAAIIELFRSKKLNKNQTIIALREMIQNRQWEKGVLDYLIQKYVEEL